MAINLHVTAALSYYAARTFAAVPGCAWHGYVLVAVPVAAMPSFAPSGTGAVDPDEAVAAGLATADAARWRVGQGMICLGARRAGALVGVTWIGAHGFDEDEAHIRFEPPPGAAWDTGMAVEPHARGGRAFAALWAASRAWCLARGLGWSMSRIADYNDPSRRAHRRMGGMEVGFVGVALAAGRQWTPGARPRLSRVGDPRPVVRPRLPA